MPTVMGKTRRQIVDEALSESRFDWAQGASIIGAIDPEESALNEQRMADRYREWARLNTVTYALNKFSSAHRGVKDWPFETINPINDEKEIQEPYYDNKLLRWVVPKNVYDKNVISRRRFLYEIDGMSLEDQKALLEPLLKINVIQRVVYSGNKSLHCVIEEEDEPGVSEGEETYKWVWRFMAWKYFHDGRFRNVSLPMKIDNTFTEVVDNRCGHPSRTTRSPFATRKDDATGGKPVEQKLLYFEYSRVDSGWRYVYRQVKASEKAERERMQRWAERNAYRNRDQGKKVPKCTAALRFLAGDSSDGWKHANLGSAVGSFQACGYSREEVAEIFQPYSKELQVFAMRSFDYFERRDHK